MLTYPWQEKQKQRLLEMQHQDRLPHALLLCGPEGIGLNEFARTFAMQMLCLSKDIDSGHACGTCQSCQLFTAGSHPDISLIEPEEEGKQLKIAQIRELIEYVTLKSFSGKLKIAIIEPADAMNRATANALLKTLEEPPPQSMLFLLSHRPTNLPITIRSRCQRVDFEPALDQTAINWLNSQSYESNLPAEVLLRLAGGGPLKALSMLEDKQLQHRYTLLKDLKSLTKKKVDPVQIASSWQALGSENIFITLMRLIQDLIRLKLQQERANLVNLDLKEDLQDLVNSLDLVALVRNYDFVLFKYQQSTGPMNYNVLSLFEEIVVNWNKPKTAKYCL
ncbi:MAG: DNA polymerase III subunit delta' [Proteobacteria bacterium]|nr:DNA polymerase III subunit delta' [Pseudomonadota bacterium]NOG59394.1 DNA polymerase III subunit delta' [Pseudomonadota bacterium]